MIVYALTCSAGHHFDAWFPGSQAFEMQRLDGTLSCPVCGDGDVRKAPMAPRVARGGAAHAGSTDEGSEPPAVQSAEANGLAAVPEAFSRLVTLLRHHLEATCEDVGERFPEEARRIHYGEAQSRAIFGEASAEEASDLRDEGIPIAALPWFHRRNG